MVLRLMPCSPRRRIRLVTVVSGLAVLRKPGRACKNLRRLDTSNGCQDHTVLPSATRLRQEASPAVHTRRSIRETGVAAPSSACRRSLTGNPPCDSVSRLTLPRPPHPIPTFVTMANAPREERDGRISRPDLGQMKTGIFSRQGLDRANHIELAQEIRPA